MGDHERQLFPLDGLGHELFLLAVRDTVHQHANWPDSRREGPFGGGRPHNGLVIPPSRWGYHEPPLQG